MNIKRCINGHFYDEDRFSQCPHCRENLARIDIPDRFKNLGIITSLGVGSTSHVFKVSGEQEYALKVIQCGKDESKYQNALYELRIMERLKGDPHVVKLCDYEIVNTTNAKTIYLLEEYHMTMSDYLSSRSFCVEDILELIKGICDSLLTCMKLGVLHFDVQPKNIFVDNLSCVMVGDFSHSLFTNDVQKNKTLRGTLAYMAPEVYQNGHCSEQSDVYSLGLILFSLFNNKVLPFMDSDTKEVSIYKRLAGTKLPDIVLGNPELQDEINNVICKACSYDTANRFVSFTEFGNALSRLIEFVKMHPEKNIQIYPDMASTSILDKTFDADSVANTAGFFDADSVATSTAGFFDADSVATSTAGFFDADSVATSIESTFDDDSIATTERLFSFGGRYGDDWEATSESEEDSVATRRRASGVDHVRRCRVCDNPIVGDANFCPYCGSKMLIERPNVDIKKVEFSALAPRQLMRGDYSIIHVVMYEKSSRTIVDSIIDGMGVSTQETRSGIYNVKEGSLIKVVLSSPDIEIDDNVETGIWQESHLDFSFVVFLPEQFNKRQLLFTASVYINDVIACKLKFIVKCSSFFNQKIVVSREDIFSAFVSYASQDRNRVAAIIQGMKKARPDMDIFFDIESLRSGDDWEKALHQEIEKRDILFLCWSHFARESKWVDAEWRYALKLKGTEGIEPIPIESPDVCPPPVELNHKHFNDKLLYIINASDSPQHRQDEIYKSTEMQGKERHTLWEEII